MGILESAFVAVLLLTMIVLCGWLIVFLTYHTVDIIIDIKNRIAYWRMLQKEQNNLEQLS